MRQHTLFTPILPKITTIEELSKQISDQHRAQITQLADAIQTQIGPLKQSNIHPYRVSRVNYVKWWLKGEERELHILIEQAGYTTIPDCLALPSRLHIYLADMADIYWFIQLLKQMLSTSAVDNSV